MAPRNKGRKGNHTSSNNSGEDSTSPELSEMISEIEKRLITQALNNVNGDVELASKNLEISQDLLCELIKVHKLEL